MNVQELREKLDLIDGECEVLITGHGHEVYEVENVGLNPYFDNEVENDKSPLCISIK